ncbi:MAG: ribonuclease P protein component [Bacteroidales bacterium]|nr:ribonuclease P protein component [Bacteroidales bacterium]
MNTLPKSERIRGKASVSALMSKGRWGFAQGLKYCYLRRTAEDGTPLPGRVMVSVPKRLFKRAVKRNLLKRRLREAYRTQKDLVSGVGVDLMLLYNTNEIMDSAALAREVASILKKIGDEGQL